MSAASGTAKDERPPGPQVSTWRTVTSRTCLALGAVVLVLGVVAGYANHVLLDGPRFADKVDAVRQTPAVSSALGRSLSDSYLQQQPDLVALRPLVQSLATSVVASSALSRPTRAAAASFQRAATTPNSTQFALRIADAGSVLTAVLQKSVPAAAQNTPPDLSLQLAKVGGQSWSGTTIRIARYLMLAAWVLPMLGLALLGTGVTLAARRRHATLVASLATLGATALAAATLLVADHVAAAQDTSTVKGALVREGWAAFFHPLWWWLGALALLCLFVVASSASLLPEYDPAQIIARAWRLVADRPHRFSLALLRALLFVALGVGTLVEPLTAAEVIGVLLGAGLLLYGLSELALATNNDEVTAQRQRLEQAERARAEDWRERRRMHLRPGLTAALTAVFVCAGGFSVWAAVSARPPVRASGPVAGDGRVCDGYAALCTRPFTDVSFAASHNAMSVTGQPGWFLGEQGVPILQQLDNGVRALLIDVWPGQPRRSGGVATAPGSYAEARAQVTKEVGEETVAAGQRVFDAVADPTPSGPEALYLCHGMCELGATSFLATMTSLKEWLDTHPDETISIIIEPYATPDRIGADIARSGLASYAYTPKIGTPWPTLRQMITSGHRLVVMLEHGSGGATYPWLVDGYGQFLQETPYTFTAVKDFTCKPNRGPADAPLFLVNHWLATFRNLVSSAREVNALPVLGARAEECRQQRQQPNFVAVNYADIGAVQQVVNQLNGVS